MLSKQLHTGMYDELNPRHRTFSDEFKKSKVADLLEKKVTIAELSRLYNVSRTAIYKWKSKFGTDSESKTKIVVEMQSEAQKTKALLQRVAELERIIGQKQLEIDFKDKLIALASTELAVDIKKKYGTKPLNGSANTTNHTTIK